MSLKSVLDSTMEERHKDGKTTATSDLAETVIETINDHAVRREVFIEASESLDDLSMLEVHEILDSLVRIMRGE